MKEYKSPHTKEDLFKMYPPLDVKRLTIGIILSGVVMWLTSLLFTL